MVMEMIWWRITGYKGDDGGLIHTGDKCRKD